jgi:hypothetical protein
MKYALVGYDKDNDVYETIVTSDNISYLIKVGTEVAKDGSLHRVCSDGSKEPFDWFEIVNANDTTYPNCYYWASYKEDELGNRIED